jgi:hypothetical protein
MATMTFTRAQLNVLQAACELYGRLHMGQLSELHSIQPAIEESFAKSMKDLKDDLEDVKNRLVEGDGFGSLAHLEKIYVKQKDALGALALTINLALGLPSQGIFASTTSEKAKIGYGISLSVRAHAGEGVRDLIEILGHRYVPTVATAPPSVPVIGVM